MFQSGIFCVPTEHVLHGKRCHIAWLSVLSCITIYVVLRPVWLIHGCQTMIFAFMRGRRSNYDFYFAKISCTLFLFSVCIIMHYIALFLQNTQCPVTICKHALIDADCAPAQSIPETL